MRSALACCWLLPPPIGGATTHGWATSGHSPCLCFWLCYLCFWLQQAGRKRPASRRQKAKAKGKEKLGVIFYSTSSKQHVIEEHLNLDKIQNLLSKKKESFQLPANFNFNDFRQLANGLFQAEGYIGCRIRPGVGKVFFPVFNLVQNFSEESLNFFITLWIVLEKKCSLNVRFSSSGKLILILSSENWKNISYLKYYFSLCYGEKYINFAKLEDIRKLSLSDIKTNIGLAVVLAYNLSLVGNPKVVKLEDILSKLGLDKINTPAPTTQSGATFAFD
jgi:hypothetical protein